MSPITSVLLLVFLLPRDRTSAEKVSCGAAEKCEMPRPNLRNLVICRTTNLFNDRSMDGIIQEIATKFCEGKTVDEIINEFKEIVQHHAEPSVYMEMFAVIGPYNDCLKKVGSNLDKALEQFKTGFKQAMTKVIQDGVKALAPYKGQCTSESMFVAMAKYMCPIYTHATVQNIVDKVRALQGAPSFGCAMKHLDGKVCHLGYYA